MRYSIVFMAAPALAFWRMECRGVIGDYRIDPLVSPGVASTHLHSILGSGAFSESVTNEELKNADCTSCLVTEDKSAYWTPALYFHDTASDTYELVAQDGGMLAYYFLNKNGADDKIKAFPDGFSMIGGVPTRNAYTAGNYMMVDPPKSNWGSLNQTDQDTLAQRAIGFNCLDYSATPEATLMRHYMPDKAFTDANCPDGLRLELMFPQCWDGKNLVSENHRDHVAYPDLVQEGSCPDTHPVRLPGLMYETIWKTNNYAGRQGEFTLSNGDRSGFSYHGDFMTGWDVDTLQAAVDDCTYSSGQIRDCPHFTIQSTSDAQSCKMAPPAVVASDNVGAADDESGATELPGGNALFGAPADGSMILTYDEALATTIAPVSTGVPVAPTPSAGYDLDISIGLTVPALATPSAPAPSSSASSPVSAEYVGGGPQVAAFIESPAFSSVSTAPATTTSSLSSTTTVQATSTTTSYTSSTTPAPTDTNVYSTQWITNGNVVSEVLWEQTTVYVTEEPTTEWTTTTVTYDAAAKRRRNAHGHMRRHQHHH